LECARIFPEEAHCRDLRNGLEPGRIDFPDAVAAEKRYDVALLLLQQESHNAMMRRVREALQEKLNTTITIETRATEVYVVTAPKGPGPALHPVESSGGGFGGSSSLAFVWKSPDGQPPTEKDMHDLVESGKASSGVAISSISIDGRTVADFCRTLEEGLDRPVVDETHLTGRYDFEVKQGDRTQGEFFALLAGQLGLGAHAGRAQCQRDGCAPELEPRFRMNCHPDRKNHGPLESA
jgi:uncharacterized protein (TIGR03435 family)